jgi:hypothetical protein
LNDKFGAVFVVKIAIQKFVESKLSVGLVVELVLFVHLIHETNFDEIFQVICSDFQLK